MTSIFGFLEINDRVWIFHCKHNLPPYGRINEIAKQMAVNVGSVEEVGNDEGALTEALETEGLMNLLFTGANICEFLSCSHATWIWASWVLSVVVEGKLEV